MEPYNSPRPSARTRRAVVTRSSATGYRAIRVGFSPYTLAVEVTNLELARRRRDCGRGSAAGQKGRPARDGENTQDRNRDDRSCLALEHTTSSLLK